MSNQKTCSPIFNKSTFAFDYNTPQIKITCFRDAGNSLAHYGESIVIISHLKLVLDVKVSRSIAVYDFKQNQVGRLNITIEETEDLNYARKRLTSLIN